MSVTLPTLCTRDRLDKRISVLGVDWRVDDDADALLETMKDGWVEILGYLENRYSETVLGTSEWVILRWVDITCMYLCERRNQPAPQSAVRRYEEAIERLKAVQAGGAHIPGAATRKALAPTLSNQRVRLQPHPNIATTPHNSTGTPSGYDQKTDPSDYEPNPYG